MTDFEKLIIGLVEAQSATVEKLKKFVGDLHELQARVEALERERGGADVEKS